MRVSFDGKRQATAEVYFSRSDGVQSSVSGSDRRKWDDDMKKALGIGGFPLELALNRIGKKEVPISFNENPVTRLNEEIKIFVTPNQYLNAKFRVIFTRTKIQHPSGAESKRWLVGPNMSYFPQQLNFAVWCATTGCGISREVLDKVPEQIKSFLMFHIYFTVRRILFEMGGIQSESALPGDSTFNQINNDYDTPSFKRICVEFGISSGADFRFKEGDKHGLVSVIIYVTNLGPSATSNSYLGNNKFSNEGGKTPFFMADKSEGLNQARMTKLN